MRLRERFRTVPEPSCETTLARAASLPLWKSLSPAWEMGTLTVAVLSARIEKLAVPSLTNCFRSASEGDRE